MPELPDVVQYVEAIQEHLVGQRLVELAVMQPHLLKTVEPSLQECTGRRLEGIRRMGKRLVFELEGELSLVLHLMIAGRLRWRAPGAKFGRKMQVARLRFEHGELWLTEASPKKRTSLLVLAGKDAARALDPGGLEPLECSAEQFRERLLAENHTLKRSLSDPRLFSGIGNAYSDEILHRARLSPLRWTSQLDEDQIEQLFAAVRSVLHEWTDRLRQERAGSFPEKVTAFHPEMAVHGRYREPCPDCDTPIQRIRHATNEINYCPTCQTEGKLLADRSLSRLLKGDWPRSLEELEEHRRRLLDSGEPPTPS